MGEVERPASKPLLYFNGIDATTGEYGLAPMTGEDLKARVLDEAEPENLADLKARKALDERRPEVIEALKRELAAKTAELAVARSVDVARATVLQREAAKLERMLLERQHLGVREGIDATDLAQAGWGVIFVAEGDPEVREALHDLLALRSGQAKERFRIYERDEGYRRDDTKARFLLRQGAAPSGPADPEKVPYYLLLVGSPERIPYSFQHQLDVQYAVGRIWFPRAEQYAEYARSVVEAERRGIARARRLSFFGVRNADDRATELSSQLLIEPLHHQFASSTRGWETRAVIGPEATRARLEALLGGDETPALLFTASHGLELPRGHERQLRHQGALLCGDWPGPEAWRGKGEIPEAFYFAGEHLAASADVAGMMVFGFACYGAGTPLHDELSRLGGSHEPKQIAEAPFVSALPMALLGRPRGALAVVGHVDRAWGCSFATIGARARSHTTTFQSTLERLLAEQPVGHAVDYLNARYAELSTELTEQLDGFVEPEAYELAELWTANNDARGYVVFGDPAARLTFQGGAGDDGEVGGATEHVITRPPEIGEADWEHTPEAVRRYIDGLRSR